MMTALSRPVFVQIALLAMNITPALAGDKASEDKGAPALWELSDADTKIYIMGTVAALCPNSVWLKGKVEAAFERSNELVTEVPIDNTVEANRSFVELAKPRSGKPLIDQLSTAERSDISNKLGKLGIPANWAGTVAPWALGITLTSAAAQDHCARPEFGVEKRLNAEAKLKGKSVTSLQSNGDQLKRLATLSDTEQLAFLRYSLELAEAGQSTTDRLIDIWSRGDLGQLDEELERLQVKAPYLVRALISDQNQLSTDWIENRMKKPGTVFFAVTAMHTVGLHSVQAMLTQRGFEVKRIQ